MTKEELNLDDQVMGYPCPKCGGLVYEIVNWAAVPFIVNTGMGKGVRHTEVELREIGGKSTLTIPGYKYQIKCLSCDYTTTPEELGMIRPQKLLLDNSEGYTYFYLPVELDFGSVKIVGRAIFTDADWTERYNEISIARNSNSQRTLMVYLNYDDAVLSEMARKRLEEFYKALEMEEGDKK